VNRIRSWIGENSYFDAFVLVDSPAKVYSGSFKTRSEAESFIEKITREIIE